MLSKLVIEIEHVLESVGDTLSNLLSTQGFCFPCPSIVQLAMGTNCVFLAHRDRASTSFHRRLPPQATVASHKMTEIQHICKVFILLCLGLV